jgi:hypothetical protein
METKSIGVVWFCGRSNIGIVLGYDPIEKKPKAWITTASGFDLEDDIIHIMKWGSKFPIKQAIELVKDFGIILNKELFDEVEKWLMENGINNSAS